MHCQNLCQTQPPLPTWKCKNKGSHPKFGKKCVQLQPGQGDFITKQECVDSGCQGIGPDISKDREVDGPSLNSPCCCDDPTALNYTPGCTDPDPIICPCNYGQGPRVTPDVKQDIEKINLMERRLLGEQARSCDLSCMDQTGPYGTWAMQQWNSAGNPMWSPTSSYLPGEYVCHWDPSNNTHNLFSATNAGSQPVSGVEPIMGQTAAFGASASIPGWEAMPLNLPCQGGTSTEWDCINNRCTEVQQGPYATEGDCEDSMCGDRRRPVDYDSDISQDIEIIDLNEEINRQKEIMEVITEQNWESSLDGWDIQKDAKDEGKYCEDNSIGGIEYFEGQYCVVESNWYDWETTMGTQKEGRSHHGKWQCGVGCVIPKGESGRYGN
tara:strand:+ start:71 stop:1213 length:1143 start_codon:yes stop_codon:yes gene_type:complete